MRREVCGSAGGGTADDRGASSVQARARLQIGGRARGGAHVEHAGHVRDAGRVEAQRLVEGLRFLPSRKQGVRYRARCGMGDRKAWG